jgi:hypothetical protein
MNDLNEKYCGEQWGSALIYINTGRRTFVIGYRPYAPSLTALSDCRVGQLPKLDANQRQGASRKPR